MKRQWLYTVFAAVGLLVLTSGSAQAQVVQVSRGADSRHAIGFTFGGFFPTGNDGRDDQDVILANSFVLSAWDSPGERLNAHEFSDVTFGAEYTFAVSEFLEAGFGVGYHKQTVPTYYTDLVNTNGSEIEQDLRLRTVPVTATIRFLPVGRSGPVQPYVGGGLAIVNWHYSEIGEFVDDNDLVFSNRSDPFVADGTSFGPVVLGGVRFPIGDALMIGGELRYQWATGSTGGFDNGFLGNKIDLGGTTANFTIHFRF